MILVPRHPERFEEVANLLQASQLRFLRRSEASGNADANDWQVLLADTVGELRWLWGLAEFGFVGGSFGKRGGQNMIEPAAFGVAVSFGPNTKNFVTLSDYCSMPMQPRFWMSPSRCRAGWNRCLAIPNKHKVLDNAPRRLR